MVLQEHPDRLHAAAFGHSVLVVIERGIPGGGLKHFELVDGVGGNEVGADEPGLLRVPGVGVLGGPAAGGVGPLRCEQSGEGGKEDEEQETLEDHAGKPLGSDLGGPSSREGSYRTNYTGRKRVWGWRFSAVRYLAVPKWE